MGWAQGCLPKIYAYSKDWEKEADTVPYVPHQIEWTDVIGSVFFFLRMRDGIMYCTRVWIRCEHADGIRIILLGCGENKKWLWLLALILLSGYTWAGCLEG